MLNCQWCFTTRYKFWFLSKFLSKFLELVTFSESYKTSSPENYLPGCLTINNSSFNCPRKACSRFKKQKVSWLPLTRNLLSNLCPIGTTVFRVLRFWPFKEEVVVALRFGAVCKYCLTYKEVFAKGDFSLVAYLKKYTHIEKYTHWVLRFFSLTHYRNKIGSLPASESKVMQPLMSSTCCIIQCHYLTRWLIRQLLAVLSSNTLK